MYLLLYCYHKEVETIWGKMEYEQNILMPWNLITKQENLLKQIKELHDL